MTVLTDSGYDVDATFLYSGLIDYWSGDGRRYDAGTGCLFALYGPDTTLRNLVDQWVDDFIDGGDCGIIPKEVTDADVREALLEMLSPQGRKDYESGALSEFARIFCDANGLPVGIPLTDEESDQFGESPVAIVLIQVVKA